MELNKYIEKIIIGISTIINIILQTIKNKNKMKKLYIIILATFFSLEINAQTWTILNSGTTTYLQGVAAISPSVCYVCGFSGLIMKTIDGGATWVTQTSNTSSNLYSICFTSATTGVAVGDGGTVLRTTDGSTWNVVSSFTTDGLRNVSFYNASTGYAGGGGASYGSVFKTTDGGATWNQQTNASLNAIYGIKFTSATDGYFCTYGGEIYKTTSGGSSWLAEVSGTTTVMSGLDFPSVNNGFIVGRTGMIRGTTTAGGSWSGITSGTTDALSDVKFADTLVGFIMGINLSTSTGTILKTTDGGATWAISYPGTQGLVRCSFVNRNCGYAVGYTGTIIKYTVSCTNPPATITPQGNTTFCQGGFVTLNANTGTGFTYQWYVNGSLLSGFTNSSYTATQSGNYTVVVSSGACSTTSTATAVTVNPNPTVTLGYIGNLINNNSATITLTGSPVGGTYSGAVSTSSFNPHTVGLGTKVINYSYTTGAGCSGNASISTIVYDTTGNVCTIYDTITTLISVTDTLIIHAVLTGISPPNNTNTIKVYPNPASDHIYINFGNYSSMNGYTCSITNTLSQQVFYTLINQQQYYIDLNTWTGHGLYFLTIRNAANSVIEVKKIVIQ